MFWLTMGYETHPNDSQQVFVDLFLYTTVVRPMLTARKIIFAKRYDLFVLQKL
jgi:hypothetical protein